MADELSMEDFLKGTEAPAAAPETSKYKKAPWFETYKQLRDSDVPLADAPTDPKERDQYLALTAKQTYENSLKGQATNHYEEAVNKQGGWGISQETRNALGADDSTGGGLVAQAIRPVRNVLPAVADLGARALQGLQVGIEGTAHTVDDAIDSTGINKVVEKYLGNQFHPGAGALALMEAFPAGGLESGITPFRTPAVETLTPEIRAQLNKEAGALFENGATKEQMNAWARDRGLAEYGDDFDQAIQTRDAVKAKDPTATVTMADTMKAEQQLGAVQNEANAFKGTPEPKATDLFPTEASRATDAEAWAEKLGAPKPAAVVEEAPVAAVADDAPTISKSDADALFKEAQAPEKQNVSQWSKSLEQQAKEFQESKRAEEVTPEQSLSSAVTGKPVTDLPDPKTGMPSAAGPTEETVSKLTEALNTAAKLNAKVQGRLYSQARSEKLKGVLAARASGVGGEAGLRAEMSALKGELPKAQFEAIRPQFKQEEIDGLFNHVSNNPKLSLFDQINARNGLGKLLDGSVPTKSEIALLDKTFPKEFVEAALKHRSMTSKTLDFAGNVLNLPRSLMSTFDLSAPLRQGIFLVGRKEFYKGFASMFKQFGSEKAFDAVQQSIKSHPNYPWMEESKLALTDMGAGLTNREEAFMSQWAERIPVLGRGVKASDRAYTGFLNKVRADTFNTILEQTKAAGIDIVNNPKAVNDIASFVNNATGRGSLGPLSQAGPVLNGLFFSPRLIASRVTLLNPAYYAQLSPVVRKEAIKSLISLGGLATTVTALAKMGGADVESDPRSSDFAKIRDGKTRYDILGGFGQYLTMGARLSTNETKTMKGEIQTLGQRYGSANRLDVMIRFATNKFSPVASFVADYLRGKNAVGETFEVRKAAMQRMLPLLWQDVAEATNDEGLKGAMKVSPGLFGIGVQTFDEPVDKKAFMAGQAAVPTKNTPAPEPAPEPEDEAPKDTLSADAFLQGTEITDNETK